MSVCSEYVANPFCSAAAAVQLPALPGRGRAPEGIERRVDVEVDQHIPAELHGFDPLGVRSESHAASSDQVRLLLDTARICDDRLSVVSELEEVQVAERRRDLHGRLHALHQACCLQTGTCTRV